MPGDLTILFRSTEQSPLGQIADAAFVHNSSGIPRHRVLGSYALIYLIDGHGTYADANHEPVTVSPGNLFILFPDVTHWYGPPRGRTWDEFYILFHGPLFDLWREAGLLTPERPLFRLGPVEQTVKRLTSIVDVAGDDTLLRQVTMVSRLQNLLVDVITAQQIPLKPGTQLWLTEACHWLEVELSLDIDMHWLADKVGLSYDAFRKKFVKATGTTPQQYRTAKRLQAAQKMLLETEMSLKEIADAVGYYDEFAFSNRFKRVVGIAPGGYRRQGEPPVTGGRSE